MSQLTKGSIYRSSLQGAGNENILSPKLQLKLQKLLKKIEKETNRNINMPINEHDYKHAGRAVAGRAVAGKKEKEKQKRKPTEYNLFVKDRMKEMGNDIPVKERMKFIAQEWAHRNN